MPTNKQRNYAYGLSLKIARFGCARFGATRFGFMPREILVVRDETSSDQSHYIKSGAVHPNMVETNDALKVFYAWQSEGITNTTWARES